MSGSGVAHFTATDGYAQIVPPQLGDGKPWVLASGVAELLIAATLIPRRTRRASAYVCIVLLVVVFPANIYAAIDGGYKMLDKPFDQPAVAWARLPFQTLFIWMAHQAAKS